MADTFTAHFNLTKPEIGASADTWGGKYHDSMDAIDAALWDQLPRDGSRAMTGRLALATTSTSLAALLIPSGAADPTAPAAGELWNNGHRLKYRNASATRSLAFLDDDITGNAATADKWKTPRTFSFTGGATGSTAVDGSENESFALTLDKPSVVASAWEAGDIKMRAGSTVPAGWLECDGSTVSRATYAALFAAIGTTYGAGDGSTTFKLPDLRGEFVRGWDHGRGVDSGRALGSTQSWAIENISGSLGAVRTGSTTPTLTGPFYKDAGASASITGANGTTYDSIGFDASRQVQTATETRPRSVALMYCIKT